MEMILLILGMFLPLMLILLLVGAVINNKKGNDTHTYTKGVKIAYTYILVVASLLMIILGSIGTVDALLDYFMPESELEVSCDKEDQIDCSESSKKLTIRNERHEGIIGAVTCLTTVLVGLPIFIVNSKDAKKYREIK